MPALLPETRRRRTFAIISHPDAGKTTLTEKLLLYGGAIQLAGSVKASRNQRRSTSDWMELEKQRGISISSTVLQFEYHDHVLNLLDTPGHDDFSADTYRTLTAADAAVMLIDNANGVETQTKKLFAVCKQRGLPIFTFVNKLDQPGPGPLAIMADLEASLGIFSVPITWPIGQGMDFKGIFDLRTRTVHLYEKVAHGAKRASEATLSMDDPSLPSIIGQDLFDKLIEETELLSVAGEELNLERVLQGGLTPLFFGSALTNFGVSLFLDAFIDMAPNPESRIIQLGQSPEAEEFSGFVFKIQANMDPNHRDRIAFLRVVTGMFEKDMDATNQRSGKKLKLSRPQRLFAQERETVEVAYPGDIIGLTNPGAFMLGDTVSVLPKVKYDEVPEFVPEVFARLHSMDVSRLKHFEKGVQQLCQEGLIQLYWDVRAHRKEPILGAVGRLQFEVVQHRLMGEYGVKTNLEPLSHQEIRWLDGDKAAIEEVYWGDTALRLTDQHGAACVLIASEWNAAYLEKQNEKVIFLRSPSNSFTALAAPTGA